MNKRLKEYLIFICSMYIITACSYQTNNSSSDSMEEKFQAAIPVIDMNKSIKLKVNSDEKTFAVGSEIPLIFNNESPNFILFETGNFIRLLSINNDNWSEVRNKDTYSGFLVVSPKGTMLKDFNITGVRPVFDDEMLIDNELDKLVRVVIIGEIMRNDIHTGEFVGAYVDVHVTP